MALWRGDSDSLNSRLLRTTLPVAEGLASNMINGGNPFALSQQGFVQSITNHVSLGWQHTHFLSFSKNKQIAQGFAIGHSGKQLQRSNQQNWDTLIVELDMNRLTHIQSLAAGMDHYTFQELPLQQNLIQIPLFPLGLARQLAFQNRISSIRNILMIDVHQHLTQLQTTGQSISQQAISNAQRDQEVLILPLDPIQGSGGSTALLDFGCISNIEYFKFI